MNLINVECNVGVNAVKSWHKALADCKMQNADGVFFPAGEYHFYPEGTTEKHCYISNNDAGVKWIVFYLHKLKNFTLTADNARFIFHGRLSALLAEECENLKLSGFSIDFAESFAHECELVEQNETGSQIRISGEYNIENNRLKFIDDSLDNLSGILRFFKYDSEKRQWANDAKNISVKNSGLENSGKLIKIPEKLNGKSGDIFVMRHQERTNPGMVIDSCCNVEVENITIYHACGMGIVAQCSRDLKFNKISVKSNGKRIIAVTDDALHLSDCYGNISIENSIFENTLDDAINVHGIYRKLKQRIIQSEKMFFLEAGHFQQFGLSPGRCSDCFELIHSESMEPYAICEAAELEIMTRQISQVKFKGDFPDDYRGGDCIRNLNRIPEKVIIRGNQISNNRPRGILASGIKNLEISSNYIHSPGAGIYISGDANFWYESGPVENAIITGNTFDNCNYIPGATGSHPVTVMPEIPCRQINTFFHGKFIVKSNKFIGASGTKIQAFSVQNLTSDLSEADIYLH